MRRIILSKNIDTRKYYEALLQYKFLKAEYAQLLKKDNRYANKQKPKAKSFYQNEFEPYIQDFCDRFNITTEEIEKDLPNIDSFV